VFIVKIKSKLRALQSEQGASHAKMDQAITQLATDWQEIKVEQVLSLWV